MGCVSIRRKEQIGNPPPSLCSKSIHALRPIERLSPLCLSNKYNVDLSSLYVALYDYSGDMFSRCVSVNAGDKLRVIDNSKFDWCLVRNLRTLREGYIPSIYISPLDSIQAEVWYHGPIGRKETERCLLKPNIQKGTFLVRDCETHPSEGIYSLSIRDYDQRKGDHVKHYKLKSFESGYFIDPKRSFPTLNLLIDHYQEHSDGLCCQLLFPYPKQKPNTNTLGVDMWNVTKDNFQFIRKLGQGMFGEVWKGRWNDTTYVAIKTLKTGSMSAKAFLEEANIMKKLRHHKLVQLYAICTKDDPLFIVTEYMANGSLLDYLRKYSSNQMRSDVFIGIGELVDFAAQIACGMTYLENNHYIHRDLAARNVLVDDNQSLKIADFGLARFIEEDEYTAHAGARFPIKWTAPEAAKFGKFSIKSDVWSFGILMTELMTYGQAPYPGMSTSDVLDNVERGYRMPKPELCPDIIYDVMLKCWESVAERRPTFEFLYMFFDDFFVGSSQPAYHAA